MKGVYLMKKLFLLLISLVMILSVFTGCSEDAPVWNDDRGADRSGGNDSSDENRGSNNDGNGLFTTLGSALAVNNAMSNFGDEFNTRISTTPLQAFGLLFNALELGTTTVNFSHEETYEDWNGNVRSNFGAGNFVFQSDTRSMNFALAGEISSDGESIDFIAYLNENRLALGSSLIGDTLYGVNFATLSQDIERLLGEFGFSAAELAEIRNQLNQLILSDMMSTYLQPSPMDDEYMRVIGNFLRAGENISDNVEVSTSRGTVNARRVAYSFSDANMVALLRDLVNVMERDTSVSSVFNNPMYAYMGISYSDAIHEIRGMIREMERELNGDITLAFYIGAGDRLLRVEFDAAFIDYGDEISLNMVLCLGGSATDIWRLDINFDDGWDNFSATAEWEIRQVSGRNIHDIELIIREDDWSESATLTLDWDPSGGEFIFSVREPSGWNEEFFRGNFVVQNGAFRLRFHVSNEGWYSSSETSVEISTSRGVNIGNVNYTNIGDLRMADFERIGEALFGGVQQNARRSAALSDATRLAEAINTYNSATRANLHITQIPTPDSWGRFELIIPAQDGLESMDLSVSFGSPERAREVASWLTLENGRFGVNHELILNLP
jgi:hypothetical protein